MKGPQMYLDLGSLIPASKGTLVSVEIYMQKKAELEGKVPTEDTTSVNEMPSTSNTNPELEEAKKEYENLFNTSVPNNKKNKLERITSKIEEKKAELGTKELDGTSGNTSTVETSTPEVQETRETVVQPAEEVTTATQPQAPETSTVVAPTVVAPVNPS